MEEIIGQWDNVEQLFGELVSNANNEESERRKVRQWWSLITESSPDMPRPHQRIKLDLIDGAGNKIVFPLGLTAVTTFDTPDA